jgi:hypothetical protein
MSYPAPVKDMLFVMQELAALEDIAKLPGFERCQIRTTFIHRDRLGLAVLIDRLLEVAVASSLVRGSPQQEIGRPCQRRDINTSSGP